VNILQFSLPLSYSGAKIVLYTSLSKMYSEGDYFWNVKKMSLTTSCDKRLVTSRSHRVKLAEFYILFNSQSCFLTELPKCAVAFLNFMHIGTVFI